MESVEVVGRVGDKIVVCVRNEASLKHFCTSLGRGKKRGEKRGTGDKLVLDASCKQKEQQSTNSQVKNLKVMRDLASRDPTRVVVRHGYAWRTG